MYETVVSLRADVLHGSLKRLSVWKDFFVPAEYRYLCSRLKSSSESHKRTKVEGFHGISGYAGAPEETEPYSAAALRIAMGGDSFNCIRLARIECEYMIQILSRTAHRIGGAALHFASEADSQEEALASVRGVQDQLQGLVDGFEGIPFTMPEDRCHIVCLIGSRKFKTAYKEAFETELELGHAVLMPCLISASYEMSLDKNQEREQRLIEQHERRIRLADSVLLIHERGYIGDTTATGLVLAVELGKPVHFASKVGGGLNTTPLIESQIIVSQAMKESVIRALQINAERTQEQSGSDSGASEGL